MKFPFDKFQELYPDNKSCLDHLFTAKYGNIKVCPGCDRGTKFHRVKKRTCYECQFCGYQLFPLAGTIFEKTRTPLKKWFHAMYLMTASKNGVSAKELQRILGVTYKCAWRMGHQIRKTMAGNLHQKFDKDVQVDEALIGGRNKDPNRKKHSTTKQSVFGIVEPKGNVMAIVVPNRERMTLFPIIAKHIKKGVCVVSDDFSTYSTLSKYGYNHQVVNHSGWQWANKEGYTTNAIEGFWSLLKRSLKGTHVWVSKKYLQCYIDECVFRYNNRKIEEPMFNVVLKNVFWVSQFHQPSLRLRR
jgi:transposase